MLMIVIVVAVAVIVRVNDPVNMLVRVAVLGIPGLLGKETRLLPLRLGWFEPRA
jgi:hypothetical protein